MGRPLSHDKTQLIPFGDHFERVVDHAASPALIRCSATRDVIGSRHRPPVIGASIKIRLPRQRHRIADVTGSDERMVETKQLAVYGCVENRPLRGALAARLNTRIKRSANAGL